MLRPVPAAGCGRRSSASRRSTSSSRVTPRYLRQSASLRLTGAGTGPLWRAEPGASGQDLGRARSTGSGPAACCASCATASAAPARAAAAGEAATAPVIILVRPAAGRQHRHGGARHGQFRPAMTCASSTRVTAGPTRRRASRRPAPTTSSTARRRCPTLEGALGRSALGGATTARQRDLAKPVLTPEQAVAEMRRPSGAGPALRHPVRAGAQWAGDGGGGQCRCRRDGAGQPQLRLPQSRPGRAAPELRVDEAGQGSGTIGRVTTYEAAAAARAAHARLAAGDQGGADGVLRAHRARAGANGFFSPPEKRPSMVQNMRTMFTRMGATRAGNPHLAGNRQGAGASQAPARRGRLSYASISSERCTLARAIGDRRTERDNNGGQTG